MDAIDKKVITQLQADGRTTLKELAQITFFTSKGTKNGSNGYTERNHKSNSAIAQTFSSFVQQSYLKWKVRSYAGTR